MYARTSNNEHSLLLLVAQGDMQAFETIFNKHYPQLLSYVQFLKLCSNEEAEDIIADLFCDLWKNRERLDIRSSLAAYLYTAAKNRALSSLKKKTRWNIEDDKQLDISEDTCYTPDEQLIYKETSRHISHLIFQLPERSRLVFLMNRDDGLSYEEIATLLNISVNSVKTHMFRSLRFLKTAFNLVKRK